MDELSKQSTIYENIHQLIGYIPTCINLMEEVLDRVEGKLGWKEFKFCFKLATSQIVCCILNNYYNNPYTNWFKNFIFENSIRMVCW